MGSLLVKMFVRDSENVSDIKVRTAYGNLSGFVGIVCNVILFFIKLVAGIISGSVAITADAVNNLTDASSSVVNIIGFKLAAKPADDEHPYGHGRYEYLAALTVSVLVMVIGYETLMTGIGKIIEPTKVELGVLTVCILVVSMAVKCWLMLFNSRLGKKIKSNALIATSNDSRNDVISTGVVLLAAVVSHFSGLELDGYMGAAVALFILYSGFGLIKEAISPLLGNPPESEFVDEVKAEILSHEGVLGIHDMMIHDYGPGRRFASAHIEMAAEAPVMDSHDLIDNIERELYERFNLMTSIHYDPVVTKDEHLSELKKYISDVISELGEGISMHDLRTVPGPTHTNVIFDCVLPRTSKFTESEFKRALSDKVSEKYKNHYCVITVDRDFTGAN